MFILFSGALLMCKSCYVFCICQQVVV